MLLDGDNIYQQNLDVVELPLENIAYGPKIHGLADSRVDLDEIVEDSLKKAGLWEEVKDRLHQPGTKTIAVSPEVILMDEPCSALDPIATARIEELLKSLVKILPLR